MVQGQIACPKCKHQMQEGFPLDRSYAAAGMGEWVEGPPEYGWLGPKVGPQEAFADHRLPLPIVWLPRSLRQGQIAISPTA
jgi:hypothetical protein